MKLAIVGSRTFKDFNLLESTLKKLSFDSLISGGAKGADELAEKYAKKYNIPITIFRPDYPKKNSFLYFVNSVKIAPLIRDRQIVDASDYLIAFWDGTSKGTKYTFDYAKKQNKPSKIVMFTLNKTRSLATLKINGSDYSIRATEHALLRMKQRAVDEYVISGSILSLGKERLLDYQDRNADVMIIKE